MIPSFLNRGALSLVAVSLLASSAAAEVFERLSAVPQGMSLPLPVETID